MKVESVGYI